MEPDISDDEAVSERVRLLRHVVSPYMSCVEFARHLGVGYTRLNNVEIGMPLGKDLAGIIRRRVPGVTTDWLFYGDARGLHDELRDALEAMGNSSSVDFDGVPRKSLIKSRA